MRGGHLALLVVALAALPGCRAQLPFGAPCDRDADCSDDFVCADDVCVPETREGEGEEGEGEEGEGEGEGDTIPGVDHLEVTGPIGRVRVTDMDVRNDAIAVAVVEEFDAFQGDCRLDLYRLTPSTGATKSTVVAEMGTFGHWVSVAVDDDGTAWVVYARPNADNTGTVTNLIAVDDQGGVVAGPTLLSSAGGSSSVRADVAIGPSGAAVALKGEDDAIVFAAAPSFTPTPIPGLEGGFSNNGLQRVALVFDADGDAHIAAQHDRNVVHAFQNGGSSFSLQNIYESDDQETSVSLAFEPGFELLVATFDKTTIDRSHCVSVFDGTAWSDCELIPVNNFDSHSHAVAVSGTTFAVAYSDTARLAPVLLRGNIFSPARAAPAVPIDAAGDEAIYTTIGVLNDGRFAVAFGRETGPDEGTVRIALTAP